MKLKGVKVTHISYDAEKRTHCCVPFSLAFFSILNIRLYFTCDLLQHLSYLRSNLY